MESILLIFCIKDFDLGNLTNGQIDMSLSYDKPNRYYNDKESVMRFNNCEFNLASNDGFFYALRSNTKSQIINSKVFVNKLFAANLKSNTIDCNYAYLYFLSKITGNYINIGLDQEYNSYKSRPNASKLIVYSRKSYFDGKEITKFFKNNIINFKSSLVNSLDNNTALIEIKIDGSRNRTYEDQELLDELMKIHIFIDDKEVRLFDICDIEDESHTFIKFYIKK